MYFVVPEQECKPEEQDPDKAEAEAMAEALEFARQQNIEGSSRSLARSNCCD